METIVVGVDATETARAACHEGARIAGAIGAGLHLVTAVDTDAEMDEGAELLQTVASELPSDLTLTAQVMVGGAADVILEEADRLEANMIVVGSVGMRGVQRVLGSVANAISHRAPCSVHIVKTD